MNRCVSSWLNTCTIIIQRQVNNCGQTMFLRALLMYLVLPVWLAAGFADYLCHRASHIERTSGWKESLLHLLQFAEMALPILAAMLFEITSGVILLMIVCLVLHQATAMWDVSYAVQTREVKPIEQHVHSVLEMMPSQVCSWLLRCTGMHSSDFVDSHPRVSNLDLSRSRFHGLMWPRCWD